MLNVFSYSVHSNLFLIVINVVLSVSFAVPRNVSDLFAIVTWTPDLSLAVFTSGTGSRDELLVDFTFSPLTMR